jgi:hypothetical protein
MKKTIIIAVLLTIGLGTALQGYAQSATFGFGRFLNCKEGTKAACIQSQSQTLGRGEHPNSNIGNMSIDKAGRIVLELSKPNLVKDFETEVFEGKETYYLSNDLVLEDDILKDLQSETPITLQKGWYPIIETKDSYLVAISVKKEEK